MKDARRSRADDSAQLDRVGVVVPTGMVIPGRQLDGELFVAVGLASRRDESPDPRRLRRNSDVRRHGVTPESSLKRTDRSHPDGPQLARLRFWNELMRARPFMGVADNIMRGAARPAAYAYALSRPPRPGVSTGRPDMSQARLSAIAARG